jgi:hypothetical protein
MKDTNMIVHGDIEVIEAEAIGSSINLPSGDLTVRIPRLQLRRHDWPMPNPLW